MKKSKAIISGVLFALLTGIVVTCSGCSSGTGPLATPTDFTLKADGVYSFKGVSDADMYKIEIYKATDVTNGKITSGAASVAKANIPGGKGSKDGTMKSVTRLPFDKYTAVVIAVPEKGSKRTTSDMALSQTFTKSGKLTVPTPTVTKKEGWLGTVKIPDDAITNYQTAEGCYGFKYEVFSDEACTTKIADGSFGDNISVNTNYKPGPDASQYVNTTVDFKVKEGTLGTAVSYWVKVMAVGNKDLGVEDTAWSEPVKVDIDGKAPEGGFFGPPK